MSELCLNLRHTTEKLSILVSDLVGRELRIRSGKQ
jgi:hypothetical protein